MQVLFKTPRIWDYKSTRGKGRGREHNNVRRGRGSQEERGGEWGDIWGGGFMGRRGNGGEWNGMMGAGWGLAA